MISAIANFLADHGYAWAKRMLYLGIIVAIWSLFVTPYTQNLKIVMMWFLNITLFKVMSEQSMSFIVQVFIFAITYKMLFWFFSSPLKEPHETSSTSSTTIKT